MIKCPFCRKDFNDVKNSRSTLKGSQIWRRRFCRKCGKTFTTYEKVRPDFLYVIKSSGKKERYSRTNIYLSIYKAALSFPKKEEIINIIVDKIESRIMDLEKKEVRTEEIADIILIVLRKRNLKTFLRFLTYNKKPKTPMELNKLLKKYEKLSNISKNVEL